MVNIKFEEFKKYINGKTASVIGVGVSNIPLISFLCSLGAKVTARDRSSLEELSKKVDLSIFKAKGVRFITGEDYLKGISENIVFKTPGLRYDCDEIVNAYKNGSVITSEMELFLYLCPSKIIAVTGSDGKTTTTTLCAEILRSAGKTVHLGGNIGTPLLDKIESIQENDFTVLELSSFQLHSINCFGQTGYPFINPAFPDVAVITNISPNHLNWHTDMEEYISSKERIFKNMREGAKLVTNLGCPETVAVAENCKADVRYFTSSGMYDNVFCYDGKTLYDNNADKIIDRGKIVLLGNHNVENYLAAIAATRDFVTNDDIERVASSFGGVEHRLELVREKDGVKYYNSSIDSTPTRTEAALSCFGREYDKKLILILGGCDKHIPFDTLGKAVCVKAKKVYIAGETAHKIYDTLSTCELYDKNDTELVMSDSWEDAVMGACSSAVKGDCVILSPACASFDAFKNFEERGRFFKDIVKSL